MDDFQSVLHRGEGLLRLSQVTGILGRLPDSDDLAAPAEKLNDRAFECQPLRHDEAAKVRPRVVTVDLMVPDEALLWAVHIKPIEERIAKQEVPGPRRGDPVAPVPFLGCSDSCERFLVGGLGLLSESSGGGHAAGCAAGVPERETSTG